MTEQEWRAVLTIALETCTGAEQALTVQIAAAVQALDVPPTVLERLQQAVMTAVRRAFQRDTTVTACMTLSTRVMQPKAAWASASWGFFIVERASEDGEHQHIEVFLYPDAS
jgi:hypothetical protein